MEAILDSDGAVCGVKLEDGTTIEADALVVACGPWTNSARTWFGPEVEAKMPQMFGVKVGLLGIVHLLTILERILYILCMCVKLLITHSFLLVS